MVEENTMSRNDIAPVYIKVAFAWNQKRPRPTLALCHQKAIDNKTIIMVSLQ